MTEIADLDVFWRTEPAGRDHNEDTYVVLDESDTDGRGVLLAVFDGMGGAAAGEWASAMAADEMQARYPALRAQGQDAHDALAGALRAASAAIRAAAASDPSRHGMGTTAVALVIEDGACTFAHVGDSRLYALHDGKIEQLTRDHSRVQELVDHGVLTPEAAAEHPSSNVITRALGGERDAVDDNGRRVLPLEGHSFLLCSDGLTGKVRDPMLERALQTLSARQAVDALYELAMDAGTDDNVTIAVVRPRQDKPSGGSKEAFLAWARGELSCCARPPGAARSGGKKAAAKPTNLPFGAVVVVALVALAFGVVLGRSCRADTHANVSDAPAAPPPAHVPIEVPPEPDIPIDEPAAAPAEGTSEASGDSEPAAAQDDAERRRDRRRRERAQNERGERVVPELIQPSNAQRALQGRPDKAPGEAGSGDADSPGSGDAEEPQ